ncbi:hypothetical protein DSECCO2_594940 [anaerobic digester metagenome]
MANKYNLLVLVTLLSFPFFVKGQIVLNDRVIDNRVHVNSFHNEEKNDYYCKLALFANSFSKKFYDNDCPIYIAIFSSKEYYHISVDNKGGSYTTELIFNKVKEENIGLDIILPDTCIELETLAKLLDLGYKNYEMLKRCKSLRLELMKTNAIEYIDNRQCELSDLLIKSSIQSSTLSKKQERYIRRFQYKNNIHCYTADESKQN